MMISISMTLSDTESNNLSLAVAESTFSGLEKEVLSQYWTDSTYFSS